jgi:hypothetical protein
MLEQRGGSQRGQERVALLAGIPDPFRQDAAPVLNRRCAACRWDGAQGCDGYRC